MAGIKLGIILHPYKIISAYPPGHDKSGLIAARAKHAGVRGLTPVETGAQWALKKRLSSRFFSARDGDNRIGGYRELSISIYRVDWLLFRSGLGEL